MVTHQRADPGEEDVTVRALAADDEAQWSELFCAYADFYAVPMDRAVLDRTWRWLMTPGGPLTGWVAVAEGPLLGFAHGRRVPESLTGRYSSFLDDLFVRPTHRGRGVGERLLRAVVAHAEDAQLRPVRWITASDNVYARRLYDRWAVVTQWVTYEA